MNDIKTVKIGDEEYPESLKKISDHPKVLYYKGVLPKNENCVAIVGTRRPSEYGQQATLRMAGDLAEAGLVVVSGMAPGIDTFAHKICVEKGKRTVAVLGTGIDEKTVYPQSNLQLSREIVKTGGCLISELPPGTRGSNFTFPRRNRIISGLSVAVLVVEAKEKSGSLITAECAKKQGKKVFAVPGSVFSINSKGPNGLIKSGAKLAENANDILKELGIDALEQTKEQVAENSEEGIILKALEEEALHIDKIIEKTRLNVSTAATTLALMEISGKIRHLGGNTYAII